MRRRKATRHAPAVSPVISANGAPFRPAAAENLPGDEPIELARTAAERPAVWLVWQLADSAFPTGGFAHSGGLEAAWQHDEVRTRDELASFLATALRQAGRNALPFVLAAHADPKQLPNLDRLCEAFTTNHVANRASRLQGRAFLSAAERIFPALARPAKAQPAAHPEPANSQGQSPKQNSAPFNHLAPGFGSVCRRLGLDEATTGRMFVFGVLRSQLASAVRLNIVGPLEAQAIQHRMTEFVEDLCRRSAALTLDDIAQTSPLLEIWQVAQDRLYSRLFQS